MDDMWLRFSRDQELAVDRPLQVAEYVIPRRFNGDIKHEVLKLWGVVRNQPGPKDCGIAVHFWTSRDGETWEELGAFPMVYDLKPGTFLMACQVPEGIKNYLALTYELSGKFETAPVVECGLVEKIDDIERGKQIVMQGGYKDLGRIEDFQAAVRALKWRIEHGDEVPPVKKPEVEPVKDAADAAPVEEPAKEEAEPEQEPEPEQPAKDEPEGEGEGA